MPEQETAELTIADIERDLNDIPAIGVLQEDDIEEQSVAVAGGKSPSVQDAYQRHGEAVRNISMYERAFHEGVLTTGAATGLAGFSGIYMLFTTAFDSTGAAVLALLPATLAAAVVGMTGMAGAAGSLGISLKQERKERDSMEELLEDTRLLASQSQWNQVEELLTDSSTVYAQDFRYHEAGSLAPQEALDHYQSLLRQQADDYDTMLDGVAESAYILHDAPILERFNSPEQVEAVEEEWKRNSVFQFLRFVENPEDESGFLDDYLFRLEVYRGENLQTVYDGTLDDPEPYTELGDSVLQEEDTHQELAETLLMFGPTPATEDQGGIAPYVKDVVEGTARGLSYGARRGAQKAFPRLANPDS